MSVGPPTVVVIGGGISGLAAAWELATGDPPCRVVLVESATRLGGKVTTGSVAGIDVDTGPDSFLARVPAATTLVGEAGLADELVSPGTGQAYLWTRGALRPLPTGLVLGVPTDLRALARSGVVPRSGVARAALDPVLPGRPVGSLEDVSVGALVRRRMGAAVQLGLVDPLLGGINAGHTDDLSAAVAAPQILAAGRRDRSLIRGLRALATTGTASGAVVGGGPGEGGAVRTAPGPVFLTLRGGLGRLVEALATGIRDRSPGAGELILGDGATAVTREGKAWVVRLNSGRVILAGAVVVSCPAPAAARLIESLSPAAADTLRRITSASVTLSILSYASSALPRPVTGSGFLVPRHEGRLLTACSWVGAKWPHLAQPDRFVVRASAGRVDDDRAQHLDDYEIVNRLHGELREAMGLRSRPVDGTVHRWPGAFPQFGVGHLDRIAAAESRLEADAAGVLLAGAALRGVGLATCISGGRAAAVKARRHATDGLGLTRSP